MPWKETDSMKERVKFVLEWERRWEEGEGVFNFAELCREFGISRQTGYAWVKRFREANHDLGAVKERSRRTDAVSDGYFCRGGGSHRAGTEAVADVGASQASRASGRALSGIRCA